MILRDIRNVDATAIVSRIQCPRSELHAGRLVSVEGIVTKASVVRPKWVRSVHYCPATGAEHTREYRDVTAMSGTPTTTVFPQHDDEGHLLETQYGRSVFRDQQVGRAS